jgi:hypothetical protein
MDSLKKTARVAGILYLGMALTGVFGLMYVPSTLFVPGDADATAKSIADNQMLYRLGIVSNLLCQILFIFLALQLYKIFKSVNQSQARLLVGLVIASVPVAFLNLINQSVALVLVSGAEFLSVFDRSEINAMLMLFLKLHGEGIAIAELFWGLWLFPFGQLVYNSGFIPRIFGILLIINCIAYMFHSLTYLLFPQYKDIVANVLIVPQSVGEFAILFWLLIKGVRDQKPVLAQV